MSLELFFPQLLQIGIVNVKFVIKRLWLNLNARGVSLQGDYILPNFPTWTHFWKSCAISSGLIWYLAKFWTKWQFVLPLGTFSSLEVAKSVKILKPSGHTESLVSYSPPRPTLRDSQFSYFSDKNFWKQIVANVKSFSGFYDDTILGFTTADKCIQTIWRFDRQGFVKGRFVDTWFALPSIPHLSGKEGLNLDLGLVTSCCSHQTACWRPACCWLG